MAKLITYVDTAEAVSAAAQSGADEIYVTVAAPPVKGVSPGSLEGAARFCRVRGVRLRAVFDFFPSQEDFSEVLNAAVSAWNAGADGIVASDPGLVLALRRSLPDAAIFGGRLMNVHSSACMLVASAMGLGRVSIAAEVGRGDLRSVLAGAAVETELVVHGPMKPGFEGTNLLPAVSGFGSELRGTADFSALGVFKAGARAAEPFLMPDICLFPHVRELIELGVGCLSVDCRGKRPEYAAVLTGIYRRAVSGVEPAEGEFDLLASLSPSVGLTDGFYTGKPYFPAPTGAPSAPAEDARALAEVRHGYLRREFQRVPVRFSASLELGGPLRLTAEDDLGNTASAEAGAASPAFSGGHTAVAIQTELYNTGGTPFFCSGVSCEVARGLDIDDKAISEARDAVLSELMEKRGAIPQRSARAVISRPPGEPAETPVLTVSVQGRAQLTPRLLALAPPVIYFPLEKIRGSASALAPFIEKEGVSVCAVMPPAVFDSEWERIAEQLRGAKEAGIGSVLVSSFGQALTLRKLGFEVRGDWTLGAGSAESLAALSSLSFASVALPPELKSEEAAALRKVCPAELIAYGRLPVVYSAVPFARSVTGVDGSELQAGIIDENGLPMPLSVGFGGRNTVYSAKKLYLAPRSGEYMHSGLWGIRLSFTTEAPDELDAVVERFLDITKQDPPVYWRGLY